jgi:hypothetical protein
LLVSENGYSGSEYTDLKRAIGDLLGRIQTGILEKIYTEYPDMDDLK